MYIITRRISAASSASARCSQDIEAAGTPGPTEGSGRYGRSCCRRLLRCKSPLGCLLTACDPDRGCQHQLTGVKMAEKKMLGGEPSIILFMRQL